MPKYELMYILASSVSDDQVPAITEQVKKFVTDFGGTEVEENQLGKKKLAYPIKRTRNGYYVVVNFDMESRKVNELDSRIRTQNSIIRYILVSLDEHLARLDKDKVAQSKLTHKPGENTEESPAPVRFKEPEYNAPEPKREPVKEPAQPAVEMTTEELDQKIEEALTEDLIK